MAALPSIDPIRQRIRWTDDSFEELAPAEASGLDRPAPRDTVWLPPVREADEAMRFGWQGWAAKAREVVGALPLVTEILPTKRGTGDAPVGVVPWRIPETDEAVVVVDPLAALLTHGGRLPPASFQEASFQKAEGASSGSHWMWPLIPGLSDDPQEFAATCRQAAQANVSTLHVMALDLAPEDRRRLWGALPEALREGKTAERRWSALFHGEQVDERWAARCVQAAGMRFQLPRPTDVEADLLTAERRARLWVRQLTEELCLVGDLWLRCGRSEATGWSLLAAARTVAATRYDPSVLAREGNLALLLDGLAAEIIEERLRGDVSSLRSELEAEYAGGPD